MRDGYGELRDDYDTPGLGPADLDDDPVAQAAAWLDEAVAAGVPQPNAASLATADSAARPSVRTVLVKRIDAGFVFYTNYRSRKGRDLAENPYAALSLTWVTMHRSVRIEGTIETTTAEDSDAYYASRPRGARLAALVSAQSDELADRATLERAYRRAAAEFPGDTPRPEHWGGYRLVPRRIEFWQGRRDRLHDRIEYRLIESGWATRRLAP